jgi:vacuolar iron transporter family protein
LGIRPPSQRREPHAQGFASRLNWLRAGVLGANDGIVSIAGLVVGVAGATSARGAILVAGIAGLAAGAVSMGLGEYLSVSSQRDTEAAQLALERRELAESPEQELAELTSMYQSRGLSLATARLVAQELSAHDAYAAHAEMELHIEPGELASPWQAAFASIISFTLGAVLPLAAIILPPASARLWVTIAVVLIALALTGAISARLGGASVRKSVVRVVVGGALGLAFTYAVGRLVGHTVS